MYSITAPRTYYDYRSEQAAVSSLPFFLFPIFFRSSFEFDDEMN